MNEDRLTDMLNRYGELCTQDTAARILSVASRTIRTYIKLGKLRAVGGKVDVRSIYEYITQEPIREKAKPRGMTKDDFRAAALRGKFGRKENKA